ncbi:thioredoxin [Flavobacteriaceae bacterium (ex Bugula neritina AB1)]|nr:thioredoxin [Flavobacteriaceae bacterium (ex Bugula neritina AB1)]
MQELIESGLQNSYSYQEYRTLVSDLLKDGLSTGQEQSEALTNYSTLNNRRMKRLDKTIKIGTIVEDVFSNMLLSDKITWLVLTEGWCGDAAQSLPVINKLAELNEKIDLRIIFRDENDELMNNFLTNGSKSIPKLIAYNNETKEVLGSWGPRPSIATKMVIDYKAEHGTLDPEFKQDLQVWYNENKGKNIVEDLFKMVSESH